MADYKVTDTELTSIADAIRAKTGKEAQIEFPTEFVSEIGSISGGGADVEEYDVTLSSGVTSVNGAKILKIGNFCFFNAQVNLSASNAEMVILTVPNEIKPCGKIRAVCGNGGQQYPRWCYINPNGEIVLEARSSGSYSYVYISLSWMVGTAFPLTFDDSIVESVNGAICVKDGVAEISCEVKFKSGIGSGWKNNFITIPNSILPSHKVNVYCIYKQTNDDTYYYLVDNNISTNGEMNAFINTGTGSTISIYGHWKVSA